MLKLTQQNASNIVAVCGVDAALTSLSNQLSERKVGIDGLGFIVDNNRFAN